MIVLAVNRGSSSLKYLVIDGEQWLAEGKVEGGPDADPTSGLVAELDQAGLLTRVQAAGHRIVHGGERFTRPVVLNDRALTELDERAGAAAQPPGGRCRPRPRARARRRRAPGGHFRHRLPAHPDPAAVRFAIPADWARLGARRYGFHRLAHRYLAERAAEALERPLADLRLVTFQLGSGCSSSAIREGRSVDSSMGLTPPNESLVMATCSGDVDPNVIEFVARRTGRDPPWRSIASAPAATWRYSAVPMPSSSAAVSARTPPPSGRGFWPASSPSASISTATPTSDWPVRAGVTAPGSPVAALVIPVDEQVAIRRDTLQALT